MKKILCGMLAGLIVMGSLPSLAAAQAKETNNLADTRNIAYRLYVSTSGNDTSGDGSQGSPFATLGKAKEKVRTLDKSSGDIVVEIADGFYSLDDTLVFGQEDSGSENCMIYYEAADGAEPVISGGDRLEGTWELEDQGKNIWKIPLERDHKLRALYVNGERSYMASTETTIAAQGSWGTYTVDGQEDWVWNTGSKFDGILYNKTDLPEITRNPEDVEIENVLAWNKNTVGIREIADDGSGHWILKLQQPYGAIAQTPGWGVGIKGSGDFSINNAYELLDQPGEFYFDKTEQMLYYIPRSGEDLETAEVVAPRLETIADFVGSPVASGDMSTVGRKDISGQVEHITMKGLTFAHSDWGLQKVGDSYGKSTCQAGTVLTAFSTDNWHYDMYRNLDTIPGAVQLEFAHHINILDGAVMLTGAEGVNMKNDVVDCQVTGNYFYQTGGSGVVVGNPQHIYENDSLEPDTYVHHVDSDPAKDIFGATADKEKYQNGLEAIPRNVTISNNLFAACARLFPSNVTVTSFYTENLQVEHNWLKDTAYSGMNIGWGWCDFDGKTADFQDWGEPYRASIIPGIPTSTCKENKLLNNRIDDTMQILHDGGSIYTLGQQDGTQIEGNYLRNTQFALYQDEGSANFATIQNNVMSGKSTYSIAAVEYGRKHDLTYDNNYATNASCGISNVPGMNIKNENFNHVADGVWPLEAYEITLNAGLQKEYVQKYADELSSLYGGPQDVVLPASVKMNDGDALPIMGFLSASDKIWLAPAGTTEFAEGDSMTVASGDAETITVPKLDGEYRIYVEYSDGTVSDASHYSVQVTNTSAKLSQHALTLYQTGKVYGQLTIENLDDASGAVWSSSQPEIATVDQNGLVKALQAGSTVITAQVGDLALTCQITVKETPVSSEALTMWFSADKGVTLDADGTSVKSWQSQTDSGVELIQNTADNMPQLITDDNGVKHLQFVNDSLSLDGVDFNNKSNLSIILVAHYTGTNYDSGWSGETNTAFFAPSSASWSGLYVAPYQKYIMARFGSGVANCQLQCNRDHEIDANSITAAVKDGSLEKVYVDGVEGFSRDGQAAATKDIGSTLYVGTGFLANNNWYYQGTISEILVYDRSLTSAEVADISLYLKSKYGLPVDLKSITATSPTKTEYEIGEELDLAGLEVTAHYEDGKDTAVSDYQVSGFDSTAAGEKTVTVSYGGQSTTFTVTVKTPVTVDSIEVTAPSKTEYEIGEALDLTGLAVTAHYSDGSENDVTDDCEVTGFDSTAAGEKTVTVSYGGQTETFTVTVKAPVTVDSIEVTAPSKTEYEIGEELDLTGLAVTAHYSDGSENDVTDDCEVTGFDSATAGEKTVTVSYEGQTATFTVTVKAPKPEITLTSIEVTAPVKTEYKIGEKLDLTGLAVTAHYSDGSENDVTADCEVTGFDSAAAGEKTVTVSYKGQKATFKVTVKEAQATAALKSITVAGPAKTEYQVGEGMDLTGLVVTAHYSDGSSKTVTGYQVTGFDSTKAGKITLTVSYSEGDLTKTASVELTVKAKDAGGNSDNNSSQGSSSSGETNSSPAQTGDRFPMAAGISLVVISFACLGALIVLKRKGKAD